MIRLNKRVILRLSDREYNELLEMRGHLFNVWSVTELLRRAITLLRQDYLRQGGPELKGRVMEARESNAMSDNPPMERFNVCDLHRKPSDMASENSSAEPHQAEPAAAELPAAAGGALVVKSWIAGRKRAAAGSAPGPVDPASGMARKARPGGRKRVSDTSPKSADLPKGKGKHA